MKSAMELIDGQAWLDNAGDVIQPKVLDTFKAAGEVGSTVKNILHGKWLGHPLHPIITDVPVGAWTTAAVLDCLELCGSKEFKNGADAAVVIGLAGAAGAAVTGITDWSGTTAIERKVGLAHGLLNMGATVMYLTSIFLRKKKSTRGAGIALSMLGYGITSVAAYLGGELVYNKQVGVNHTAVPEGYPEDFVAVLPADELNEGEKKCVRAEKVDVLLVKKLGKIYALANTCSHLGGPLAEGEITEDGCVRCPWHQSEFLLSDGSVKNGPATEPQPTFEVREHNGQIEVRLQSGWV